jgi:4-amino-4-deoxy-L-arabinose transferase-like glycosyltransferase
VRISRNRTAILAIVALALVVRLAVVVATPGFAPAADAADFDRIATSLADHGRFPNSPLAARGGPTAFRPPLLALTLAAVYKLSGTADAKARWTAGRVLEAGLGAIAVLLICVIGIRVLGRAAGLVAGGLAAIYPPLVMVGSSLLSESVFIPLMLAAVWAALNARAGEHRLPWAIASGVLVGLAALARANGIVLLIPIWFLVWDRRPRRSLGSLQSPLALLAATVVTLIPWTVRDFSVFDRFVPLTTDTGFALAGTYNPLAQGRHDYPALWIPPLYDMAPVFRAHPGYDEAQVSSRLTSVALSYIGNHPSSVPRTLYWTFLRLFNLSGTGFERYAAPFEAYPRGLAIASVYAFWLLALLAIAGAFTAAARRAPLALWACPLAILLTVIWFEGSTRYRSPADPFFILLAALGALALWDRAVHRVRARERLASFRPAS